jgi:hypothetical protein
MKPPMFGPITPPIGKMLAKSPMAVVRVFPKESLMIPVAEGRKTPLQHTKNNHEINI